MSTQKKSVITLDSVNFSYDGMTVLKNVSLEVFDGEFLGIVGPNAGGKSTLLKLILGQLQPQNGNISVLGDSSSDNRHRIGYVSQHPSFPRDFPVTVEEVVLLGRLGMHHKSWFKSLRPGRYKPQDYEAVRKALTEVEGEQLLHRQIGSLSGGQLQRVLLARALVSDPEILMLDEPTANIDQRLESDIFDLLKRLNERMTILVVSHDIGFVSSYVTRIACINQTLVCHHTDAIDGQVIQSLYGEDVRMIAHHH